MYTNGLDSLSHGHLDDLFLTTLINFSYEHQRTQNSVLGYIDSLKR